MLRIMGEDDLKISKLKVDKKTGVFEEVNVFIDVHKRELLMTCSVFLIGILVVILFGRFNQSDLESVRYCYLDVGQGDCLVIIDGETVFMIDGGGDRFMKDTFNKGKEVILPFLVQEGIKEIDLAFITHNHYDHIKGIIELVPMIHVKEIALPSVYQEYYEQYIASLELENNNTELNIQEKAENVDNMGIDNTEADETEADETEVELEESGFEIIFSGTDSKALLNELFKVALENETHITFINEETCITSERVTILCLYPFIDSVLLNHENDNSLVLLSTVGKTRTLHMGDAEAVIEEAIIQHYSEIIQDVDILKVGHHGSISSSSEEFIDLIQPTIGIILVGENLFGHPHYEIINRYEKRNIPLFLTQNCGMIEVVIKEDSYEIIPYKGEQP